MRSYSSAAFSSLKDPAPRLAASLKRSADTASGSIRPYRTRGQSLLTFYINRAGKILAPTRLRTLERCEGELREQFGRDR